MGYSSKTYPANLWLMVAGGLFTILAISNISLLAPLFGYSLSGKDIVLQHGEIDGMPGEHIGIKAPPAREPADELPTPAGSQGRATYHTGSTTQGGSNYGQGSSQLGAEAYRQGGTKNAGANYANENERLSREHNADASEPKDAA